MKPVGFISNRSFAALYLFMIAALFSCSFGLIQVPIAAIYAIVLILFLSALFAPLLVADIHEVLRVALLGVTPFSVMLIIIDPVEIGLFGHDSYLTLRTVRAFGQQSQAISEFVADNFAFPGFSAYLQTIHQISGVALETVGKYLPLCAATIPIIYYVTLKRFTHSKRAYVAAIVVSSLQTLLYFESRLVDESLAVMLLFVAMFLFSIRASTSTKWLRIATYGVVGLIFWVHHVTTVMAVAFAMIWSVKWSDVTIVSRLVNLACVNDQERQSLDGVVIAIIAGAIVLFVISPFLEFVVATTASSIALSPTEATAVANNPPTDALTLKQTLSKFGNYTSAIVIGIVGTGSLIFRSLIGKVSADTPAIGRFRSHTLISQKETQPWQLSYGLYGGGVLSIFVFMFTVSSVINLDAFRLYIFFMPPLIAVFVCFLSDWRGRIPQVFMYSILVILIVGNVFSLPTFYMVSDQSETSLRGGHYTEQDFAAAERLSNVRTRVIIGSERELWEVIAEKPFLYDRHQSRASCDRRAYVWRSAFNTPRDAVESLNNKYYSSGTVAISNCVTQ